MTTAPAAAPPADPPPAAPPPPPARQQSRSGQRVMDRLELEATQITGNRELPKVLYIVPWKRSDLGDLVGRPVNSLLDEVLAPVDRDVFKRENRYYTALQPGQAGAAQGSDGEHHRTRLRMRRPPGMRDRSQLFRLMSFSFRKLV